MPLLSMPDAEGILHQVIFQPVTHPRQTDTAVRLVVCSHSNSSSPGKMTVILAHELDADQDTVVGIVTALYLDETEAEEQSALSLCLRKIREAWVEDFPLKS